MLVFLIGWLKRKMFFIGEDDVILDVEYEMLLDLSRDGWEFIGYKSLKFSSEVKLNLEIGVFLW